MLKFLRNGRIVDLRELPDAISVKIKVCARGFQKSGLICCKKKVYTNPANLLPMSLPVLEPGNSHAAPAHPARFSPAAGGLCVALVVEITPRTAAGRHYHRTGKFQFLLSSNNRSAGVIIPVAVVVVVVTKVIIRKQIGINANLFLKGINVDLYESMLFWFVKEFVKAILGLGFILAIVVFLRWISSDE